MTFPVDLPHAARPPEDAQPRSDAAGSAFLGRQPILDRAQQLVAYELLYREDAVASQARFSDARRASLTVIASLLQDIGAEQVLGGKLAFINVGPESLGEDSPVALLDPRATVLELSTAEPDPHLLPRLAALRAQGYGLALTVDSPAALRHPAFQLASHVKVDLQRVPMEQLPLVARLLRGAGGGRQRIAEKVETRTQANACLALGFDGLQGFYFARPETLSSRKLEPARAAVMQAIRLLLRNADVLDVDAALKRDVALSVKLLRYMNAAGVGPGTRIESLRHAITLLGYNRLARWLTLLLATAGGADPVAPLLARTAITRGRLMELLGEGRFDGRERDDLFIAGTFSLLPAMLLVPMRTALHDLQLPAPVSESLLARSGAFAPYLKLAEACEDPSLAGVGALCGALSISPKALNLAQVQAADWVRQLGL
jgi:EAL and modified HD-GYP domain-containing signal transduction protein